MASSDLVYCDQCGGASPRGSAACRFCGAALPPPRPGSRPGSGTRADATPPPPTESDDPWADLHAPAPEADHGPHWGDQAWGDPSGLPWRGDPSGAELPPTQVGAWQAESTVPPVYGAEPHRSGDVAPDGEPTMVQQQWDDGELIEPGAEGPRRGLPGWAWVASVVLLGTLLGVGAYLVVDNADDDSVRTEETSTTTSSTTTSTTSTTTTTLAPTTVPVVPATPPVTPPDTGLPTVPGAVTTPTTLPPTTIATTLPPTTPAPTTAPPTTLPPTTPAPTTPPPTAPPAGGTVPGDLGIPGVPMTQPACDGQYVTFLASAKNTSGPAMQDALESFPGSHYLRTDQTCPSLNSPASDGSPLYRIYLGPYANVADACAARAQGTQGSFVKRLSDEPPTHVVTCPDAPT